MPLRILVVDMVGEYGGFHYYISSLAIAIRAQAEEVLLLTPDSYYFSIKGIRNIRVFGGIFGSRSVLSRASRLGLGFLRVMLEGSRFGPDIMHIHAFRFNVREAAVALISKLIGARLVVTVHDVEPFGAFPMFRKWIMGLADAIILHNAYSAQRLAKAVARLPPTYLVPHGNYTSLFETAMTKWHCRELLGLPQDVPLVLFFGNPRKEKGLTIALEAICNTTGSVQLVVAGKQNAQSLAELGAVTERYRERVILRDGLVSSSDAPLYYTACDIVILPYTASFESGVGIMAQSAARPIIVSDLPALAEMASDAGLVCPPGDALSFAQAIDYLAANADVASRLGHKGLTKVTAERAWDIVGTKTAEVYSATAAF